MDPVNVAAAVSAVNRFEDENVTSAGGAATAQQANGGGASSGGNGQRQFVRDSKKIVIADEPDTPMNIAMYDEEYSFSNPMRARVAIFNHYEFKFPDKQMDPRNGTEHDVKKLKETLPNLGFHFEIEDIEVHQDLTKREIEDELDKLSKTNFDPYNCLFIVVLTHGGDNNKLCAKDDYFNVQTLWKNFVADKCPTLAGKPKIFILQACRGGEFGKNVKVKQQGNVICTDSSPFQLPTNVAYTMPVKADFLHIYSTDQGQVCFRDEARGSWFIQQLCASLLHYSPHLDILRIITRTALHVAVGPQYVTTVYSHHEDFTDSDGNVETLEVHRSTRQVPAHYSTLTRDLYFRPT